MKECDGERIESYLDIDSNALNEKGGGRAAGALFNVHEIPMGLRECERNVQKRM